MRRVRSNRVLLVALVLVAAIAVLAGRFALLEHARADRAEAALRARSVPASRLTPPPASDRAIVAAAKEVMEYARRHPLPR